MSRTEPGAITKPARERLYVATKRAVDTLPPWLLRLRPFHVYTIPLANHCVLDHSGNSNQSPQYSDASWILTSAELDAVAMIADRENVAAWNGTTRRAVVAMRSSEPVGVAWIATEWFEERQLGLRFELANDEAWLHSAFVVSQHRRRGIYRRLLNYALRALQQEGWRRLLLGVTIGNEPSRRAHEVVGAANIGNIAAARVGGLTVCSVTGKVHCTSSRRIGIGRQVRLRVLD